MAGYRGHIAGAAVSFLLLMFLCSLFTRPFAYSASWFFCSIAGGLFPDVDIKSYGQMKFYKLLLIIFLALFFAKQWIILSTLSLFAFLPLCVNHRGLFHNIWFIGALSILSALLLNAVYPHHQQLIYYGAMFFIGGALSHLYLDLGLHRIFSWRF